MITEHDIVNVYVYLRTSNTTFSDELLDFIKEASIFRVKYDRAKRKYDEADKEHKEKLREYGEIE